MPKGTKMRVEMCFLTEDPLLYFRPSRLGGSHPLGSTLVRNESLAQGPYVLLRSEQATRGAMSGSKWGLRHREIDRWASQESRLSRLSFAIRWAWENQGRLKPPEHKDPAPSRVATNIHRRFLTRGGGRGRGGGGCN